MFPAVVFLMPLFIAMRWLNLVNTQTSLIITYMMFCLPLSTWFLKGFYDNIPVELEQAARIDGATRFQAFIKIVMPLSASFIMSVPVVVVSVAPKRRLNADQAVWIEIDQERLHLFDTASGRALAAA